MSETTNLTKESLPEHGEAAGAHEIHLPPNSWVPFSVSLALAMTMVGFLDQVRQALGPTIWIIGLVWLIGSLVAWLLAARAEYLDLPESAEDH